MVDLHSHSNRSDGSLSPTELIDLASAKGLSAIALTDHDTVTGLDEAMERGYDTGVNVIPGVELSCDRNGHDVHIVGLFIDHHDSRFIKELNDFVDSRSVRNRKMCDKLTKAGLVTDYDELCARYGESVITRAHFARYMLEKGYIKSVKEAFDRYIGDHCPYYVPREKVTPERGMDLIKKAGGLPILAHPLLYGLGKDALEDLVIELKEAGLVGMEAIYGTYTASDERDMRKLAAKHDLLISGGSDFHGDAKPGLELGTGYGKMYVDDSVLDTLTAYKRKMI
ncbi:MAG: PHP domain-containing protein [Lachnospiraceae bacterium]|nr:PHP domain-containing protein [Lachnospiraceae bacterium]